MAPALLDDDKMNIDNEALDKLVEKLVEKQKLYQVMNGCVVTEPQLMLTSGAVSRELNCFLLLMQHIHSFPQLATTSPCS